MCIQEKPSCRHQTPSASDGGKCSHHPSVQNLLEPCGEFTGLDGLDGGKSHESVRSVPTPVRTVVEVAQSWTSGHFFFVLSNVVLEGVFPIYSPTGGRRRGRLHHSLIRIWSRSHQHSPPGSSAAQSTGGLPSPGRTSPDTPIARSAAQEWSWKMVYHVELPGSLSRSHPFISAGGLGRLALFHLFDTSTVAPSLPINLTER